jgi:3-deoxy-manno-octulosonate cytidylyltransferase (CMP-KDO synthetase)
MNIKKLVCIPARLHSTRLPGKPLLKINGKTIIHHVHDNVSKLNGVDIVVLTDDVSIKQEVESFGGVCHIITEECLNGTDRIIKYLTLINTLKYDVIVNVQGDEPFISSNNIQLAIDNYVKQKKNLQHMVCSTLFYKTKKLDEIKSKSRGKVVLDLEGNIMYCSRNVIPSNKKNDIIPDYEYNIHIGIFVFDYDYLVNMYKDTNTHLQLTEDIEWMKIMEQGYKINAVEVIEHEIGVDTQIDYDYLVQKYE